MGIFKKVFKGVGKVFKKVGKFIKKGWAKLGKFMNKLGIAGQIGMMLITGGLASMAFGALQTLGQGFMTGLAEAGWATATATTTATAAGTAAGTGGAIAGGTIAAGTASGAAAGVAVTGTASGAAGGALSGTTAALSTLKEVGTVAVKKAATETAAKALTGAAAEQAGLVVAKEGFKAGTARLAHGILTGAAKIATTGSEALKDSMSWITDNVIGTVTDVTRAIGNTVKVGATDVTHAQLAQLPNAVTFDKVLTRAAERLDLSEGFANTGTAFGDVRKLAGDIMPGGDPYAPSHKVFTLESDQPGLFGKRAGQTVTMETTYNTKARKAWLESKEFQNQWAAQNKQAVAGLGLDSSAIQPDFKGLQPTQISGTPVRPGDPFTLPADDPLGFGGQVPEGFIDPEFETYGPKTGQSGVTKGTGLMSKVRESAALDKHFTPGTLKSAVTATIGQELTPHETPDYSMQSAYPAQSKIGEYSQAILNRPGGVTSPIESVPEQTNDWSKFFDAAGFGSEFIDDALPSPFPSSFAGGL